MSDEVDREGQKRVYRLLSFMAWCDDELVDQEREVLDRYRDDFGLSELDAATLETQGREVEGMELGDSDAEAILMIDGLIDVAVADGKLVLEEQARLHRLAKLLGRPQLVDRMVRRISERDVPLKIERWEDPPV